MGSALPAVRGLSETLDPPLVGARGLVLRIAPLGSGVGRRRIESRAVAENVPDIHLPANATADQLKLFLARYGRRGRQREGRDDVPLGCMYRSPSGLDLRAPPTLRRRPPFGLVHAHLGPLVWTGQPGGETVNAAYLIVEGHPYPCGGTMAAIGAFQRESCRTVPCRPCVYKSFCRVFIAVHFLDYGQSKGWRCAKMPRVKQTTSNDLKSSRTRIK